MDRTLANFIRALRNSEIRISTAETLDAFNTVELVGYKDRSFLKRSLSLVLSKTEDEKQTFENCFDQFFSFEEIRGSRESRESEGANDPDGEGVEGSEGAEGGDSGAEGESSERGEGGGTGAGGKKGKPQFGAESEEEEDLGPGELSTVKSALGQLLMTDSKVELSVAM